MPIRISNLRLPIGMAEANLPTHSARLLGVPASELSGWRILRKSLDARDKDALEFVYSVEVQVPTDADRLIARAAQRQRQAKIEPYTEPPFVMPAPGVVPLPQRPVVLGSGPGGLLAAYFLAEQGYQPLVLERGTPVHERIRDVKTFDAGGAFAPESNYLFGEGGAGTFSDGKLTCRSSGPDLQRILQLFADCKGKPSVVYEQRPHLGSNRLPAVVKALRQRIEAFGGEVRFHCRVEDILHSDGQITGVVTSSGTIPTSVLVLAPGHSARDTFEMLVRRGIPLAAKPFQMGVRVEHPQATVNRVQYGPAPLEDVLGSADYALVAHGANDVFTFCMCAGGYIIPSVSQEGYFCTNGMSLSQRNSPYANSGLVVTVPVSAFEGTDVLAGVRLQARYEQRAFALGRGGYACPVQRARDFLAQRPVTTAPACSYPRESVAADLREVLPPLVADAVAHGLPQMDRKWRGRFLAEAVLVGPEARGSSPIRILRDDHTRAAPGLAGLYPVGEGAGYAGGIVSAAIDGLRTAKAIIAHYAPLVRQ
jgi:hypothetical protein